MRYLNYIESSVFYFFDTLKIKIFFSQIHELTLILAQYAVPNDWRLVARNFLVFTAVLVPIGIHDGMF